VGTGRFAPLCPSAIIGAVLFATAAVAQGPEPRSFAAKQVEIGADIYERNCAPCHGAHMLDPQAAFNLRSFPHDQHDRFVSSVTRGKNQMPPWGDLLKPEEIEALWAYVVVGGK
jgi:mono/diheme cytochrome c family protein